MKLLAAISFFFVSASGAFAFSVSPMVVEFDPNAPRAEQVFVLTNPSDTERPIEISVAKPFEDENGIETLDKGNGEDDFLIIPQQFILPPNSRRSVKVFYVGKPRQEEDTFRILFKELPVEILAEELPEGESSFSMNIVMEYHTRVWLTPRGLKENLALTEFEKIEMEAPKTLKRQGAEIDQQEPVELVPMLRLTVANTGERHGYIRNPVIRLVSKNGSVYTLNNQQIEPISGQVVFKDSSKSFKIRWDESFPEFEELENITLTTTVRR